jgi:NitT/TauT family transport system substrate-binding protein
MSEDRIHVRVAPKGMGLNEFVAMEEGFFADTGLEVEFDMKVFRGTQSSWKGLEYFNRPQDQPYAEGTEVIQSACQWGTISNAASGMGRVVPDCYGVSPWGIFVRPESNIQNPEDLADVPIAVGMRAGSHFNVPYRLEKFLPLEKIKSLNIGGFSARLEALINGEVDAASLLPPQIDMAKQLGMRAIIEDEFITIWWVPDGMSKEAIRKYIDALVRAENAIEEDLPKYLSAWKHSIPEAFHDREWDFSKFSRGEKFVNQPLPDGLFEEVFEQVDRWDLAQHIKDRNAEHLVYSVNT